MSNRRTTTKNNRKSEDSDYGNDLEVLSRNAEFLVKLMSENADRVSFLEKVVNG